MKDLSVLLVDNNPLLAQLLTRFFQSEEHVRVAGTTTRNDDVVNRVIELRPDAVLIDLDASVKNRLDLIRRIRAVLPEGLLIAMTLMDTTYYRSAVLEAGANEIILKSELSSSFLIYMHENLNRRKTGRPRTLREVRASYSQFAASTNPE